jgi:hypothetical protein
MQHKKVHHQQHQTPGTIEPEEAPTKATKEAPQENQILTNELKAANEPKTILPQAERM